MPGKLVIKKGNPLKKTKNTFFQLVLEKSVCQLEVFWCQAPFYQLTLNKYYYKKKEKEQRRTKIHALMRGIE